MFVKVDNHNLAALFLGGFETSRHSFFTHDALTVAQLSVDGVFRILMAKRHGVGINDDGDIGKGMKNEQKRTEKFGG